MSKQILDLMVLAALEAGEAIMEIYGAPIVVTDKTDGTPVTEADAKAEQIIIAHLNKTGLPILAEECAAGGDSPALGDRFFVVDPLDGTKEFIKRNGQFTVNIALIEDGAPVLGVVLAPDLAHLYIGGPQGAYEYTIVDHKLEAGRPIKVKIDDQIKVIASRSHQHPDIKNLCAAITNEQTIGIGSSLKFCLVARGDAQLYPRFSPTCEWDTAAGHAVLEAAGGVVLMMDKKPMRYGVCREKYLNPRFVAAASHDIAASAIKEMHKIC